MKWLPRGSRAPIVSYAALLIAFTAIGVTTAVGWIGQPFAGFLVLGNGVVASAGLPDWPATRDGEIFQGQIVSVEAVEIERPEDLVGFVRGAPEGTPLHYRLAHGGQEVERQIATRRFELRDAALIFGAYLLNGLFLGAIALVALGRSDVSEGTRKATPFLVCASLWGLSAMDLYGAHVLFRAHALLEALLFATALQLALEFPSRLFSETLTRRLVGGGYAVSVTLVIFYELLLFDPGAYVQVHLLATSLAGCALLAIVVGLVVRFARSQDEEARTVLRVPLVGAGLALLMPVAVTLPEILTGGSAPQNVVAWTVFIFPLAIGYAMRRPDSVAPSPARM